jgi:hypothetical protein
MGKLNTALGCYYAERDLRRKQVEVRAIKIKTAMNN